MTAIVARIVNKSGAQPHVVVWYQWRRLSSILSTYSGLGKDSVALCNQIRCVDETRFGKIYGVVSTETMKRIDKALKISLALD